MIDIPTPPAINLAFSMLLYPYLVSPGSSHCLWVLVLVGYVCTIRYQSYGMLPLLESMLCTGSIYVVVWPVYGHSKTVQISWYRKGCTDLSYNPDKYPSTHKAYNTSGTNKCTALSIGTWTSRERWLVLLIRFHRLPSGSWGALLLHNFSKLLKYRKVPCRNSQSSIFVGGNWGQKTQHRCRR